MEILAVIYPDYDEEHPERSIVIPQHGGHGFSVLPLYNFLLYYGLSFEFLIPDCLTNGAASAARSCFSCNVDRKGHQKKNTSYVIKGFASNHHASTAEPPFVLFHRQNLDNNLPSQYFPGILIAL